MNLGEVARLAIDRPFIGELKNLSDLIFSINVIPEQ